MERTDRKEIQAGNSIVWFSKAFLSFLFFLTLQIALFMLIEEDTHICLFFLFCFVCSFFCYLLLNLTEKNFKEILLFLCSFHLYFFVVAKRHKVNTQKQPLLLMPQ